MRLTATFVLLLCLAPQVFAVDGTAVAVQYRSHIRDDRVQSQMLQAPPSEGLYRINVKDSKVVKTAHICKDPAAFASISPDGKRVVFYRCTNAKAAEGAPRKWVLSIMNVDGSGLRDLVKFEGDRGVARTEWPLGPFVYYMMPDAEKPRGSAKMWRVNVDDPKDNKLFWDLDANARTDRDKQVDHYALDLAAQRIALRISGWGMSTAFNTFPPKHPADQIAKAVGRHSADHKNTPFPGARIKRCGTYMSPSGRYICTFPNEGHGSTRIHKWDHKANEVTFVRDIEHDEALKWGEKMPKKGGGRDHRWSTNSDKWLLACLNGEFILINWVDEEAVAATTWGRRGVSPSGDFWVAGGPEGAYESIDGKWVKVGGKDESDASKLAESVKANKPPQLDGTWPVTWNSLHVFWPHNDEVSLGAKIAERMSHFESMAYARYNRHFGMDVRDGWFRLVDRSIFSPGSSARL